MWLLATKLDRAVLESTFNAKKAVCWKKRSFSHVMYPDAEFSLLEGGMVMKARPSIKIPSTFSSEKKYT